MMSHSMKLIALSAALWVAGCANPADDKFKATATAPKPVEAPATEAAKTPSPGTEAAPAPATSAKAIPFTSADSKIEFVGSKVTGSHNGGFKTFSGTAEPTPDSTSLSRISVEIDMNSTWADNEKLTTHLKSPDFFDVAKFPKSEFVTTEIKPGTEAGGTHTITGNLTLHGVTKSISFPAKVAVSADGLSIASEFAINRKDFDIRTPGKPDDLIRDEVVIKLDIKGGKAS